MNSDEYLLLFADLVGSTEVASELNPEEYANNYMASFHWAARCAYEFATTEKPVYSKVKFKRKISGLRLRGDEVSIFCRIEDDFDGECKEDLVASAIAFAYTLKLCWLAAPYNVQRMLGFQFPRDLAVGIHIGPAGVVPGNFEDEQIASLHINVAKRIESAARTGDSLKIFASSDVSRLFKAWKERHKVTLAPKERPPLLFTDFEARNEPIHVKGLPIPLQLKELSIDGERAGLKEQLQPLSETPAIDDIETEEATRTLAEMFLLAEGYPFRIGESKVVFLRNELANTANDYVKTWFQATSKLPRLFKENTCQLLSCYFLSCAFLRHQSVSVEDGFMKITREGYELLDELLKLTNGPTWEG